MAYPVDGVHVHVDREQVVAALGAVLQDVVEEVLRIQPLALQPPLHVGERDDDRVDLTPLDLGTQLVETEQGFAVSHRVSDPSSPAAMDREHAIAGTEAPL